MAEPTNDADRRESTKQPDGVEDESLTKAASSSPTEEDPPLEVRRLPGPIGSIADALSDFPREWLALGFVISVAAGVLLPHLNVGFFDCWETHYGEVAREMVVRDDYLYPYWKSAHFFSKPILLFWLMAAGFNAVGADERVGPLPALTEAAARLPVSLIALFCVVAVYLAMSRIFNRRAGIFSAIVMVSTPFWAMVGRQAITDMPYVGLSTAGLCFFMIAMFSPSYQRSRFKERVSKWVLGFFLFVTLPQYWLIIRSVKWLDGNPDWVRVAVFIGAALLVVGVAFWLFRRGRDSALMLFYMLVALATLAKGIGGFALPGLVILCYLLVSWDWAILRRAKILTGAVLFVLIAFPWYVVLTLFTGRDDEHKTFFQRFWIHDHLNRIAVGVHGDEKQEGTFDYFIRQLGFGVLSWAAIMPIALFDAMRRPLRNADEPEEKGRVFIVVWAMVMFIFFTAMQTKFHHYILPAIPPLSMLAGLWLSRLWDKGRIPSELVMVGIFAMTMLVAYDGVRSPWAFIDLFTYHYVSYKPEYYFPRNFGYSGWVAGITGVGLFLSLCVVLYGYRNQLTARLGGSSTDKPQDDTEADLWASMRRRHGIKIRILLFFIPVVAVIARFVLELLRDLGGMISALVGGTAGRGLALTFSATGLALGLFFTQVYFLQLAPHWSQRYFYNTYWTDRRGNEPNLAYLMNWRGETFYALNTDQQIKDANGLKARLKGPGRKYIIVESKRYKGLLGTLGEYKDKAKVIDRSSSKWYLVRVDE